MIKYKGTKIGPHDGGKSWIIDGENDSQYIQKYLITPCKYLFAFARE